MVQLRLIGCDVLITHALKLRLRSLNNVMLAVAFCGDQVPIASSHSGPRWFLLTRLSSSFAMLDSHLWFVCIYRPKWFSVPVEVIWARCLRNASGHEPRPSLRSRKMWERPRYPPAEFIVAPLDALNDPPVRFWQSD